MENRNKKKIIVLTMMVIAILVIILGTSYAFFRFSLLSYNQELVAGQIYMHYKDGNRQVNIEEGLPSTTYDENQYFEFTIDGKNTSSKDIWYAITLLYGEKPNDRSIRIADKFLKFTLFENDIKVVDGAHYKELNNKKLWVNKIEKNTTEDVNIAYKLYMWISDKVEIGEKGDYTTDVWNNQVYASIKVNVVGDFIEKTIDEPIKNLIEVLKAKAYTEDSELIAIDVTDKNNIQKCESVEACEGKTIEYRYSGPTANNYIKLTDNNEAEEDWRIIGIFTDESGEEYLRVVRDSVLPESYLPDTYTINNASINGETKKVTYTLKYNGDNWNWAAYWNKNDSGTELNRWEESGLQYFLNTEKDDDSQKGYLSHLSDDVKDLLQEKKLYLGTVTRSQYIDDTPKQAYKYERATECVTEKGTISSNLEFTESEKCRVWNGNLAVYDNSKVSLMYPSDYGFSASESYWDSTTLYHYYDQGGKTVSWMYRTMADSSSKWNWFLSPGSNYSNYVARWDNTGALHSYSVNFDFSGVRPVLNLPASIDVLEGNGKSSATAYKIF